MRKLIAAVFGIALLLVAFTSTVEAGKGPRLNGSFKVTATILSNDIGIPPGSVTSDTYVFKSTCKGSGACAKVGLTRESGGRDVKSTLQKVAPGVYKGNEGPEPYTCVKPIGAAGQFTSQQKVTVTKAQNGVAKKISGKATVHITGCTETIEEYTFRGRLTQ